MRFGDIGIPELLLALIVAGLFGMPLLIAVLLARRIRGVPFWARWLIGGVFFCCVFGGISWALMQALAGR